MTQKARRGRPKKKYSEEYAGQARKLCERGATDAELADFFNISIRTFYRWKHEYKDFWQAVSVGKEAANERVERSLFQRATGYERDAVKIFMPSGADEPVYAEYLEHVPADVGAAKMWLTNRSPERWKEKQEVEHTGGLIVQLPKDVDGV